MLVFSSINGVKERYEVTHQGGDVFIQAAGDFGAGTLSLELDLGGGFAALSDYEKTEENIIVMRMASSIRYRFSIVNATAENVQVYTIPPEPSSRVIAF